MNRRLRTVACLLALLAPACTDEGPAETPADAPVPSEADYLREARDSIHESNADAEFRQLRAEVEDDQAGDG